MFIHMVYTSPILATQNPEISGFQLRMRIQDKTKRSANIMRKENKQNTAKFRITHRIL